MAARKRGTWRKPQTIKRNIELYSSAYHFAWCQVSPLQKREQPKIALLLHASIRHQIDEGATDPLSVASEALSELGVTETE